MLKENISRLKLNLINFSNNLHDKKHYDFKQLNSEIINTNNNIDSCVSSITNVVTLIKNRRIKSKKTLQYTSTLSAFILLILFVLTTINYIKINIKNDQLYEAKNRLTNTILSKDSLLIVLQNQYDNLNEESFIIAHPSLPEIELKNIKTISGDILNIIDFDYHIIPVGELIHIKYSINNGQIENIRFHRLPIRYEYARFVLEIIATWQYPSYVSTEESEFIHLRIFLKEKLIEIDTSALIINSEYEILNITDFIPTSGFQIINSRLWR